MPEPDHCLVPVGLSGDGNVVWTNHCSVCFESPVLSAVQASDSQTPGDDICI